MAAIRKDTRNSSDNEVETPDAPWTLEVIFEGWKPVVAAWHRYRDKFLTNNNSIDSYQSTGLQQVVDSSQEIIAGRYNTIVDSLGRRFAEGDGKS